MQSRLFTIFMTLTIAPPLIQQLQPRYLHFRQIYQSRESNSKIYSWVAFVIGAILPEIPYSFVAGSTYKLNFWLFSVQQCSCRFFSFSFTDLSVAIYFNCWYWGVGFHTGFEAGYVYLVICAFELFYVGFGQAIASFAPNELLASLFVPFFFLFVVSFCGVVVPYAALSSFWRSWMYWLTPFHYLLEGLLATVTHGIEVKCDSTEFARFAAPPGQNCTSYTEAYVAQAGGYVQTGADGMCEFCQYANGDEFAASFNAFYSHIWRNYGIFWAYILFNFSVVFLCSWLYLGGARRIRRVFSPKTKQQAREAPKRNYSTV